MSHVSKRNTPADHHIGRSIFYSIASERLASRMGLSTGNRCRTDLRLFNKFTQGTWWF